MSRPAGGNERVAGGLVQEAAALCILEGQRRSPLGADGQGDAGQEGKEKKKALRQSRSKPRQPAGHRKVIIRLRPGQQSSESRGDNALL